jgi:hypothetical protein
MTLDRTQYIPAAPTVFPIMGNRGRTLIVVDWATAEAARDQAEINHGQTLEALAARGGMTAFEMLAALKGEKVTSRLIKRPLTEVEAEVREFMGADQ